MKKAFVRFVIGDMTVCAVALLNAKWHIHKVKSHPTGSW